MCSRPRLRLQDPIKGCAPRGVRASCSAHMRLVCACFRNEVVRLRRCVRFPASNPLGYTCIRLREPMMVTSPACAHGGKPAARSWVGGSLPPSLEPPLCGTRRWATGPSARRDAWFGGLQGRGVAWGAREPLPNESTEEWRARRRQEQLELDEFESLEAAVVEQRHGSPSQLHQHQPPQQEQQPLPVSPPPQPRAYSLDALQSLIKCGAGGVCWVVRGSQGGAVDDEVVERETGTVRAPAWRGRRFHLCRAAEFVLCLVDATNLVSI